MGLRAKTYPPLRDNKGSIYEGGHREPFVARWPGKIAPGTTNDQIISVTDVLATLADILGQELPDNAGEDSVSFLPCLLGKDDGPFREASVQQSGKGAFAIRRGPWKLIAHGDLRQELFNLGNDIGETKDVIESQPEIAKEMADLLESYLKKRALHTGRSPTSGTGAFAEQAETPGQKQGEIG